MGLQGLILVFKVANGIISMNQSLLMVGDPSSGCWWASKSRFWLFFIGPETVKSQF